MFCPFKDVCDNYPNCPKDFRECKRFKHILKKEGLEDIKPVEWKPDITK